MRALIFLCALLWAMPTAAADWTLNGELSGLSFGSVKKGDVGEVHHFTALKGSVTEAGDVTITVNLESVETWLDIRNERLREFLFETAKFPLATITAKLPADNKLRDTPAGTITTLTVPVTLSLHGKSATFATDLVVARISANRVLVMPGELIMLDANVFDMAKGIQKLMELAELPSISAAVPVTFHLVFDAPE